MEKVLLISLLLIGVISSCSNNDNYKKYVTSLYFNAIPAYHGLTYTCLIMTDVL